VTPEPNTRATSLEALAAFLQDLQERIRLALNLMSPEERWSRIDQVVAEIRGCDPEPGSLASHKEFADLYGRLRRLDPEHGLITQPARQLEAATRECSEAMAELESWRNWAVRNLDPQQAEQQYIIIRRGMLSAPVHDLADVAPQHPIVRANADLLALREPYPRDEHPDFWRAVDQIQYNPDATLEEREIARRARQWSAARDAAGSAPDHQTRELAADEAIETQRERLEPALTRLATREPDHPLVSGYMTLQAGGAAVSMLRYEQESPQVKPFHRDPLRDFLRRLAAIQPEHDFVQANAELLRDDPQWRPAYTVPALLAARQVIQERVNELRAEAFPWTLGQIPDQALDRHVEAARRELKELVPCLRHLAALQPDHPWVQWGKAEFPFVDTSPARQPEQAEPAQPHLTVVRSAPNRSDNRDR